MDGYRVGLYTEVYRPIRNGVVASVDALAASLVRDGAGVRLVAPWMPGAVDDPAYVRRIPSLPLPTRTGYRLCVPFDPSERAYTIVHAHSIFVTGALALRAARIAGAPLVYSYHTRLSAYAHYAPGVGRASAGFLDAYARAYANLAAAVVVPTRAVRDELHANGVRTRIEIVPTGVDAVRLSRLPRDPVTRARLGARAGGALVLWVGRIAPEKNVPLALAAFSRLRPRGARLAIVGDGIDRTRMERMARDLGIAGDVRFAGEVDSATLGDAYASCDALLFTSETETQGLVLWEARAAGLPIVAVDGAVTREVAGPRARLRAAEPSELAAALDGALDEVRVPASASEIEALAPETATQAIFALYASLRPRHSAGSMPVSAR